MNDYETYIDNFEKTKWIKEEDENKRIKKSLN